jgi:hypothetical protein
VTDANRWRVVNAALILVILAGGATAVLGRAHHSGTAAPAVGATPSPSSSSPTTPAATAPAPVKPTRAHLCTFLAPGDFQALGVPSPAFVPFFGPGGTSPLPGQLTCSTHGVNGYATFWTGPDDADFEYKTFANDKARDLAAGWAVHLLHVAGADEAMWIAQDELPTVPLTPDQQAELWGHTDTYQFYVAIPRGTPNPGPVLQSLAELLVSRIAQLGYAKHSPTDGMS